jgi:hypothetical protein
MVDTLEITKKLEGAGFERGQAEAVAAVVAGGAGARDKQLDEIRGDIGRISADLGEMKTGLIKLETLIAKSRTEQIIWTVAALGVLATLLRLFP